MEIAIHALKAGAFDFVNKPINGQHLQQLLEKAFQSQPIVSKKSIEEKLLIGESTVIQQLRETIKKVARTQAPVFITGESGTGKEVVAKLIHQLSPRHEGAFIAINCGAIPADLIESELFGHKKGSFTGATQDKLGLIQSANGGSLFLDEVAELPLNMQVKLLRAVQEKKIRPIGADTEIPVDFRIISATHQNLEQLIQKGEFRQDLFFRLHVMDIRLPPLRERGQDILLLAHHFLQKICSAWQIPQKQFSDTAQQWLLQQPYVGNVRELHNMIERATTLCDGNVIHDHNLSTMLMPAPQQHAIQQPQFPEEGLESYLENIEKKLIMEALEKTHWNRTLAAKKLKMSFRSLRYRLKKFGLDTDD